MSKQDNLEDFVRRVADAARLCERSHVTVMMQAGDVDPLSFTSVLRVDDTNPFSNGGDHVTVIPKIGGLIRSRAAAHKAAERVIHMEDLNRHPDFVNAYLKVYATGEATFYVHYGMGGTTIVKKVEISEELRKTG